MGSIQRAFGSHADLVSTFQPWLTSPLLMDTGFFWGFQHGTGLQSYWDIQDLKDRGYIKTTTVRVVADIRGGKTSLGKCVIHGATGAQVGRAADGTFRRARSLVHDRDLEGSFGEYKRLCDELIGNNIQLADHGEINLFDPMMCETEADYIRVATEVCTDSKGDELDPLERLACQVTAHRMMQLMPGNRTTNVFETMSSDNTIEQLSGYTQTVRDEVLAQVDAVLDDADLVEQIAFGKSGDEREQAISKYRDQFVTSPHIVKDPQQQQQFLQATTRISTYMGNLLRGGQYGGMFGNKNSVYDLLTDDVTVLDWNGVPEKAANLLEALMHFWVSVGLRRGDNTVTPDYILRDEEGSAIKNPRHAALMAESGRKSRKRRSVDISQQQFMTDCLEVGSEGSDLRYWGEVIHNTTGMWVVGSQPIEDSGKETDIDKKISAIMSLGVSELNAYNIVRLPQGCWAVILPHVGVDFVQHFVLPSQWSFVLSDGESRAAAARMRVSDDPGFQDRLRVLNTIP